MHNGQNESRSRVTIKKQYDKVTNLSVAASVIFGYAYIVNNLVLFRLRITSKKKSFNKCDMTHKQHKEK